MFSGGWKKVKKDLGIRRSIHLSYRGNPHKFMIFFFSRQGYLLRMCRLFID